STSFWKVPSPLPRRTEIITVSGRIESPTARSCFPSLLKSATTTKKGAACSGSFIWINKTETCWAATSMYFGLDTPPLGGGLVTVITPVVGNDVSDAVIIAVTCEPDTNVVARADPFQFTTEPTTNPEPFTVKEKSGPPGAIASGTSGWLMKG